MPLPQGQVSTGTQYALIANFFLPLLLKFLLNKPFFSKLGKSACAFICSVVVSIGAIVFGDTPLAQLHDMGNWRNLAFTIALGAISCYTAHQSLWSHMDPKGPAERADENITDQQIQADKMNQVVTPTLQPKDK